MKVITLSKWIAGGLGIALSLSTMAELGTLEADFADSDELECVLEPSAEIDVSAAVEGVLSGVLVQRGDSVKRGQKLAQLVSGPERAAVETAKARVEFGVRKGVRNDDLYKKELISIHERDEMDTELLISRRQLNQAEEELKLRTVRSPINGIVVEREKDPGEYVENDPIVKVVSLNPLNVEVVAPAERFGTIKKGMRGNVRTVGPLSASYEAEVTLIDQMIDAASGTIRLRLSLPNPDNAIPAGLKCYVNLIAESEIVSEQ